MRRIISIALVAVGLVIASTGVGQARAHGSPGGHGGRAHAGGRPAVQGHPGFQGHPRWQGNPGFSGHAGFVDRRAFQGHRVFRRGGHGGVFVGVAPFVIGPAYAYGGVYDPGYAYSPPVYSAPAPSSWYYCPSAGAYYPDVPACPEPWVPVPTQ
jgi:hypothetical protein